MKKQAFKVKGPPSLELRAEIGGIAQSVVECWPRMLKTLDSILSTAKNKWLGASGLHL
jgi:hypothetical protein